MGRVFLARHEKTDGHIAPIEKKRATQASS